jgi:hypothetical protein
MRSTLLLALTFLAAPAHADIATVGVPDFGSFTRISCCSNGLQVLGEQTSYDLVIDGVNLFCGDVDFCQLGFNTGPLISTNGNVWMFGGGGSIRGSAGAGGPSVEVHYPDSAPGCAGQPAGDCEGPDGSFTGTFSGLVTVTETAFGFQISGPITFSIPASLAEFSGFSPDYDGVLSASFESPGGLGQSLDPQDGFELSGSEGFVDLDISGLSVPEPGSLWLLAAIIAGIGLLRIVRARRSQSLDAPLSV